jgi:predicted lipid-binding transport protein (Tim44 family)
MSGQIDFTALVFLVIAVIVFLKLRSVLGRRTEDDEARIDRYRSQRTANQQQGPQSDGKIVTLPRRDRDDARPTEPVAANQPNQADRDLVMTKFGGGNAALSQALIQIGRSDSGFDPTEFMNGAKAAYEMIVQGFATGDRKMLGDLLSAEVFSGFVQAIQAREDSRETVEQSFVGIKSADMIEAEMKNGSAQVTVKFVSEIISAIKSATGEVVSGDPMRIKEVTDVWTFARDVRARDPNWKLVATQAAT